jgi:hypothetical protein
MVLSYNGHYISLLKKLSQFDSERDYKYIWSCQIFYLPLYHTKKLGNGKDIIRRNESICWLR